MIMTKTKFYKRVSIKRLFLLGLVISLSSIYLVGILIKVAFAQDINLCLGGTPTFNILATGGYTQKWYSNASNVNDNNTVTFVGFNNKEIGSGYKGKAIGRYEVIVEFLNLASVVNKVNFYRRVYNDGYHAHDGYEKTFLFYNGDWHLIDTRLWGKPNVTGTVEITGGPWNEVTKVKLEVYNCASTSGIGAGQAIHYTYELRAFGLVYEDIGLRVFDGTQTVSIAIEPLGTLTSPLRIAKDGVIYGIALVDVGDPNESGIRIRTSSGIKALRKYP